MAKSPPGYDEIGYPQLQDQPPAYGVQILDPKLLERALRIEVAKRRRLERQLRLARAEPDYAPAHLNHTLVIQARRQEEPRTVGVIAFNDSCPYQAHEPRERLTRRAKIFWTFLILMCIALLVIPIIIIAHQNG
ncbi:unnamed protein product, partial [Mesorhabditis spiculigera]